MSRVLKLIFLSVFSIGLLVACGSDDDDTSSGEANTKENTEDESKESDGKNASGDGAEEITRVIDKLDDEGWIFEAGVNLSMPNEFPSDYPKFDDYTITEREIA